jgi:(1->4)-alpha-D-glucan 1-alpha-D-glucosylmutase
MLHDFYGRVLEEGGIQLQYGDMGFWVCYGSLRFPLSPDSYGTVLDRLAWFKNPGTPVAQKLEQMAVLFRVHPDPTEGETMEAAQDRNRERDTLRHELARLIEAENLTDDLQQVLKAINGTPGHAASFNTLHDILEAQHYRLAFWKSGTHEINYRRFFAVDTLVGLHMERQEVFDDTHRLLQYLLGKGVVTGVRIDHIDGLWDPAHYLQRLSNLTPPERGPTYILVEKILTEREALPTDWSVHGTSGYEFTGNLVNLFIDSRTEETFTKIYRDFAGLTLDPHEQAYELKLFIMEEMFPNAIDTLVEELEAQVKSDRRWRDWTGNDLRLAISRIIACLSVYRTYRRVGHKMGMTDVSVVERAVAAALRRNHSSDPLPFHFVRDVWTGLYPDAQAEPGSKKWADEWVCKLQQYTGAIMAKSIEDTLFYRYVRLFGANEVGHHPAEYGLPTSTFHEDNAKRLQLWPANMLGTSTHDTKVSEDVRTRLFALAELPERWADALRAWGEGNRGFKTKVDEALAPDANEEYLLYQILLGAWPLDEAQVDDTFRERIRSYMRKALSESKANTNWAVPNEPWMKATCDFVDALLDREKASTFWESFRPFAADLAWRGMLLSLTQVALKLTSPGVPDVYQGCEMWDLSLVDPDNRRPVDYTPRPAILQSLKEAALPALVENWKDGRIKMRITRDILAYRREHPTVFTRGAYIPVTLEGTQADRLVAFLRQDGAEQLLVVGALHLGADADLSKMGEGTDLLLTAGPTVWRSLIDGTEAKVEQGRLSVRAVLGALPVAVLRAVTVST